MMMLEIDNTFFLLFTRKKMIVLIDNTIRVRTPRGKIIPGTKTCNALNQGKNKLIKVIKQL